MSTEAELIELNTDPAVLIDAFEGIDAPFDPHLINSIFPFQDPELSLEVHVDIYKESGRRIATVQDRDLPSQVVQRKGYERIPYTPAYINESRPTRAGDVFRHRMGTANYSPIKPQQALQKQLAKDLRDLKVRFLRRLEYWAAKVLETGKSPVVGRGEDRELDFRRRPENTIILTGDDRWTTDSAAKHGQLVSFFDQVKRFRRPTRCYVGAQAAQRMLEDEKFMKQFFDLDQAKMGTIDPKELSGEVTWLGRLKQRSIEFLEYSGTYFDESAGMERPFIPEDKIILCSDQAYAGTYFGAIETLSSMVPTRYYIDTYDQKDPDRRVMRFQSSPLVAMHEADSTLVVKVL